MDNYGCDECSHWEINSGVGIGCSLGCTCKSFKDCPEFYPSDSFGDIEESEADRE